MQKLSYKKMPREELITHSQQDDFKALEELIRREQKNIYTTLMYLSGNKDNVYDLTQETLFKIAKNIKSLANPKNFKSWANQIATNVFYDDLRKNKKDYEVISLEDDENSSVFAAIKNFFVDKKCKPPEICLSSELDKIIKYEILNLPESFRIVIILRELEGLSYEEIALATNSNIGTVKSRISRARNKLQENLKAYL
ncbi:MAG: sigma-70 family RNA polymerase sigma factor [Fusobacterium sp.]|nr:sigma-70 family RNA polymerase sigma factor [Fusobacterium sp.]